MPTIPYEAGVCFDKNDKPAKFTVVEVDMCGALLIANRSMFMNKKCQNNYSVQINFVLSKPTV